ncbi:hypothetical protein F5J12DRAFT_781332 [Pisolithus orientalis]|uniref:uncharacterized protein n=1 Tax=Pisolithus orientalis TaxID=936130 RepID=UPI00222488D2|nr:uncharacterized protein F5J12DRAFT_781332 [Pisolithus orientalis]KAI6015336.1 hypothetical protein F5J12DRAFT_781332 [Pisolithus orientalis]
MPMYQRLRHPASASNNNNYDPQICQYLNHAEKCRTFELMTSLYESKTHSHGHAEEKSLEVEDGSSDDGDSEISDCEEVWYKMWLQNMVTHDITDILPAQTLFCSPPCETWTLGHYDAAIINVDPHFKWPESGLKGSWSTLLFHVTHKSILGHVVGQLHLLVHPVGKRGVHKESKWPTSWQCHPAQSEMSKDSNKNRYQTIDGTYKLIGSLPPPKHSHTVHVMDKFTASELEGTIIHKPWIQVSSPQSLGYVTNIIFKSFRDTFTSIAPSYSTSFNQGGLSEDSLNHHQIHDAQSIQQTPVSMDGGLEQNQLARFYSCKCTALVIPLSPFPSPTTPSPHLESGILPSANSLLTPTSPKHIPAIRRIQVNKTFYKVLNVLFLSTGFLGRGTVCYLACYNGEYYIIKDYWVEESEQRTALHKVNMMKLVQDIDGVPKLQHYWVVKVEPGISQRTHMGLAMKPCARPMVMFKTKKELVSCIQDILQIQQQALERGVLHQDCSINNTMIKDFANGSCSFLLDWEFAVWVTLQGEYDLGSTEAITKSGKTNVPSIWKSASLTCIFINHPTTIHHTFVDDIESLFYIFIWILILYDGPLGHKCQDISHEKTLLGLWSEKAAKDLEIARCTKFTFLNDLSKLRLDFEVSQYFQDLIPLANECMPYKKPPEMMNAFQQIIAQHKALNSSMCLSQENDMDVMSSAIMSSKCLCEECFNSFAAGSPPINLEESQSVATVGLCCSRRAGAGSGGRAKQLEQIGTAIEGRAPQTQKLTDLPNNSVVNPLAPLPTWQKKGGGCSAGQNAKSKSNVTPPPYAPPIVNGPSPADMPPNPVPQSSTAVATPVFHQCPTDSHHFGFSVLAQQPGRPVSTNTSHPPTPQPNYQSWFIPHQLPATVPNSCIDPSLDSLLSSRQTLATTDIHHKSLEKLSSEGSSEEESESLSNNSSDAEAGEVSSDESNKDEDDAFGWGAMNLRQSTHPGTCQRLLWYWLNVLC